MKIVSIRMALPRKISPFFDLSKFTVKSSIDKPWGRGGAYLFKTHLTGSVFERGLNRGFTERASLVEAFI